MTTLAHVHQAGHVSNRRHKAFIQVPKRVHSVCETHLRKVRVFHVYSGPFLYVGQADFPHTSVDLGLLQAANYKFHYTGTYCFTASETMNSYEASKQ